jgi:hypothetical protein
MSKNQKIQYDFSTEKNLEVMMKSGTWVRVTCDTFRCYYGPRRINHEKYDGIYYYRDTNQPYDNNEEHTHRELYRSDYKPKVGKNHNPWKRGF